MIIYKYILTHTHTIVLDICQYEFASLSKERRIESALLSEWCSIRHRWKVIIRDMSGKRHAWNVRIVVGHDWLKKILLENITGITSYRVISNLLFHTPRCMSSKCLFGHVIKKHLPWASAD